MSVLATAIVATPQRRYNTQGVDSLKAKRKSLTTRYTIMGSDSAGFDRTRGSMGELSDRMEGKGPSGQVVSVGENSFSQGDAANRSQTSSSSSK